MSANASSPAGTAGIIGTPAAIPGTKGGGWTRAFPTRRTLLSDRVEGSGQAAVPFPPPRRSAQPYAVDSGRLSRPRRRRTRCPSASSSPTVPARGRRAGGHRGPAAAACGARGRFPPQPPASWPPRASRPSSDCPRRSSEEDDGAPSADDAEPRPPRRRPRAGRPSTCRPVRRRCARPRRGGREREPVVVLVTRRGAQRPVAGPARRRGPRLGGAWALGSIWQPFVVVLCGGLLVLLGFLLLVPARAHRLVGVLALLVSLAAAAAVVLLLVDGGWGADQFRPGPLVRRRRPDPRRAGLAEGDAHGPAGHRRPPLTGARGRVQRAISVLWPLGRPTACGPECELINSIGRAPDPSAVSGSTSMHA